MNQTLTQIFENKTRIIDAMKADYHEHFESLVQKQESIDEKLSNLQALVTSVQMELNNSLTLEVISKWKQSIVNRLESQSNEFEILKTSLQNVVETQELLNLNMKQMNETLNNKDEVLLPPKNIKEDQTIFISDDYDDNDLDNVQHPEDHVKVIPDFTNSSLESFFKNQTISLS